LLNYLTIDVEDYFQVSGFEHVVGFMKWDSYPLRIEATINRILKILNDYGVNATFFVLGWIAEKYPHLVAAAADAGHEIACHSFYHRMVSSLSPDEFKRDTELAINAIVKACGQIPKGYRSPSWGMRRDMQWAFDILDELGFIYDSSIFPIRHDIYGDVSAPKRPFEIAVKSGRTIVEVPATTLNILGSAIPLAGGGWLRQFPYWFTRWGIKKLNSANSAAMTYMHPWELDPDIPRVKLDIKNRIRQYGNLNTMQIKLERLLDDFDFIPMIDYITILKEDQAF